MKQNGFFYFTQLGVLLQLRKVNLGTSEQLQTNIQNGKKKIQKSFVKASCSLHPMFPNASPLGTHTIHIFVMYQLSISPKHINLEHDISKG